MRVGTPGFIGARLTEAREARGLSQIVLARQTRLKAQSISHYEQSRQSPSPEAFDSLCKALALPHRFFLQPGGNGSTGNVFFRSTSIAGRPERLQAARHLGWLKAIAACVGRYADMPPARIPLIAFDSSRPDSAESIAAQVRRELHNCIAPLPDLFPLFEKIGCVFGFDAALQELTFTQWDRDTPWIVIRSRENRATWLRYRLAHELGHLVMHRKLTAAATHRELEDQADRFARALLLPKEPFADDIWAPTLDALLNIKSQWQCPVSVMVRRCGEIGRFDSRQVQRALANLARRGWNTNEPREPQFDNAHPLLLARTLRVLIEERGLDVHSLLNEIALSPADVEELTGLPPGYLSAPSELLRVQSPHVVVAQVR